MIWWSVAPPTVPAGGTYLTLPGGVLGRVDDMLIVRGVNVYPSSIEDVLRGFPEVERVQDHAADRSMNWTRSSWRWSARRSAAIS